MYAKSIKNIFVCLNNHWNYFTVHSENLGAEISE
jgi:hypothetical protein